MLLYKDIWQLICFWNAEEGGIYFFVFHFVKGKGTFSHKNSEIF